MAEGGVVNGDGAGMPWFIMGDVDGGVSGIRGVLTS